jgi:hypothetical protein
MWHICSLSSSYKHFNSTTCLITDGTPLPSLSAYGVGSSAKHRRKEVMVAISHNRRALGDKNPSMMPFGDPTARRRHAMHGNGTEESQARLPVN